MYSYSSVVSNIQDKCIRTTTLEYGYICLVLFVTTRGTDTFVLYVTDYTGVRIHLSCMLLTTLEYDTFVLFCNTQDKYIRTPV
jgi:hypothetical protein